MKPYLVLIIASIGSVIPINLQTPSSPQSNTLYRATKTFNHKVREVYTTIAHPAIDFIDEIEPNDSPVQAHQLSGPFPVGVIGSAITSDIGSKSVMGDDVEDLYKINIRSNPDSYEKTIPDINIYSFTHIK